MKEFIMLFRGGNPSQQNLTQEEIQAHMQLWGKWMGSMGQKGQLISGKPLAKEGKTVTKKLVNNTAYAEGNEVVGGYIICTANTFDEAEEISKGCPVLLFDDGVVEIRPIQQIG